MVISLSFAGGYGIRRAQDGFCFERERYAYHEAGHTVAAMLLEDGTDVVQVAVDGDVDLLCEGATLTNRRPETTYRGQLAVSMAGIAAEMHKYGNVSGGLGGDGEDTVRFAAGLAREEGISAGSIREEIAAQMRRADAVIARHPDALDAVAHAVMERGRLNDEEVRVVLAPWPLHQPLDICLP